MHPVPERPRFAVAVTRKGDRLAVAVSGEVDLATAGQLEEVLRRELARRPVTLDLAAVSYLDSSGIRLLDTLLREDRDLLVDGELQRPVRQVLEMTGMMDVLPFVRENPR